MENNLFSPTSQFTAFYDTGLRRYLLAIYHYMTAALVMTGAVAYFSAQSETFLNAMYLMDNGAIYGMRTMAFLVMFAPLALVMFLSFGLQRMSLLATQISYWIYAAIMGLSLSVVFLSFAGESIARVFFITAATFGVMSLYGYTTQRDLTGLGSFLFMGLIGLIIASLVNLFLKSSGLQFIVSVIGVLIFTGLTAYDTQKLKALYSRVSGDAEWQGKLAIMGALTLYLDFINIFLNLLNLLGERRR